MADVEWALVIGMGIALIIGESIASLFDCSYLLNSPIGAKGKGIGYTKGLPSGAPPEAEFTYLAPNVILTEKVRHFENIIAFLD